jgi:hypothetical protein
MSLDSVRAPSLNLVTNLSHHGFMFDRPEELAMYRAFLALQEQMPRHHSLLITRAGVRVPGHTFYPDLLVVHDGRAGVIEIDGATHHGRAAADRSRDRLLEDAGIRYVDRLDAESASDPKERDLFVERFLARLVS